MLYGEEPPRVSDPPPAGVLLVNLGSPEAATARAVRVFLRQALRDQRVVERPALGWWLVRNLLVLPIRPIGVSRAYRKIWTEEGAPLVATTRHLAADLEWALGQRLGRPVPVFAGMRYGKPSIPAALGVLRRRGCTRLLVLPLYPQYSAATTGSAFDAVFSELTAWRRVPDLRTVSSYHDHPAYIAALTASIREQWHESVAPSTLILSFHGVSERFVAAGDPYEQQCRTTAAHVSEGLPLEDDALEVGFQSRFEREPGIGLDTAELVRAAGRAGSTGLDVVCPGSAVDCLETLEGTAITGDKIFTRAGGSGFRYIPALNRRPDHVAALAEIAIENMAGWLS